MKKSMMLMTFLLFCFSSNAQFKFVKKAIKKTVKVTKKVGKTAGKAAKKTSKVLVKTPAKTIKKTIKVTKKVGKTAGKAIGKTSKVLVKAAVEPVKVPTKSVYNTGRVLVGKAKVSEIYKPYTKAIAENGKLVPMAVKTINYPPKKMMRLMQGASSKIGGRTGEFIFDLGTFTNRYFPELGLALAHNVSDVASGKNPLQVIGSPLAGAIRAARERHIASAKPLPQSVKVALKGCFPQSILSRAKYAVGTVEITLPNFIGKVIKYGDGYAVVVNDIIVFNQEPGNFSHNNAFWWIHELTHVQQYNDLGIESFSYSYMKDLGKSLEKKADANAARILRNLNAKRRFLQY